MNIIPVIDLLQGQVVHASGGVRTEYAPIRSRLCRGSDPRTVVEGLLQVHPFECFYIADLDAIAGTGSHDDALRRLRERYPDLILWVDAGLSSAGAVAAFVEKDLGRPVVGSESLRDCATPGIVHWPGHPVLSLDFHGTALLGPEVLLERDELWPEQVIVMSLARVGSDQGPELERIAALAQRAPQHRLYAAGGVRNARDLAALARTGAAGALVATALHNGSIDTAHLALYP